jgi:hypothetical protein
MRLGRIGFDQVVGHFQEGLHSVESRTELIVATEHLTAQAAAERMAAVPDRAPIMLDGRVPEKRRQRRLPGERWHRAQSSR